MSDIPVSPELLRSFLQMGEQQVYLWRTLERLQELWPDTKFAVSSRD